MATVVELFESRETSFGEGVASHSREYLISGTDSEVTALEDLASTAPSSYSTGSLVVPGMARMSLKVKPLKIDTAGSPGQGKWLGEVKYGNQAPGGGGGGGSTGDVVFEFDTGGETEHITQSLETVSTYGTDVIPQGGAIGFDGDRVNGCDIFVPAYNFSIRKYMPAADVTQLYRVAVADLTGKVNDDTFQGFAASQVLFLGASGSQRSSLDWELTFRFSRRPTEFDKKIGPTGHEITVTTKRGWDYLWVYYDKVPGDGAQNEFGVKLIPKAVYVEKVYEDGDFDELGL